MLHMLSDLDNCAPCVWGELFLTVVTLHVKFGEFSHEGLLNFCIVVKLFFDSDFDLDSFWMALCPNKPSVDNFCFVETLDFFNNNANNSLLSLSHAIHGGLIYLWQNRQKLTIAYFVIPIVMSVLAMVHAGHTLPIVGRNWTPHIGHNMVTYLGFSIYILFFTFC